MRGAPRQVGDALATADGFTLFAGRAASSPGDASVDFWRHGLDAGEERARRGCLHRARRRIRAQDRVSLAGLRPRRALLRFPDVDDDVYLRFAAFFGGVA